MAKTAFLCPGQGAQAVGMGRDLYEAFPHAKERFLQADAIMDFPLSKLCFEGPEETLKQTKYTQPALFVHSAVVADLLCETGVKPDMTAGHSLGEYSALYAAGAADFEATLKVVRVRGEAMQYAGQNNPGTMAAIIGLEEAQISGICAEASSAGIVEPANFNSPGQVVISGSVTGVRLGMDLAKRAGARMVKELEVSGAFHSPLMGSASEALFSALDDFKIRAPLCPVYANAHAQPLSDPEAIRRALKDQLLSPVLWLQSISQMIVDGADKFVEIGQGRVLTGLLKRIDRSAGASAVGTAEELKGYAG